jgi:hypothetical protein
MPGSQVPALPAGRMRPSQYPTRNCGTFGHVASFTGLRFDHALPQRLRPVRDVHENLASELPRSRIDDGASRDPPRG